MPNVYLISDTHFGHKNIVKFDRKDGTPLRPWNNLDEMHGALIKNWNSVVKPEDKVYHLGDATMDAKALDFFYSLNGTKILIKGNHDTQKLKYYLPHFKDIRACHELGGFLLSHIPVNTREKHRYIGNIHGHLHQNVIDDPWYFNVSVEQINYTPILFDDVVSHYKSLIKKRILKTPERYEGRKEAR